MNNIKETLLQQLDLLQEASKQKLLPDELCDLTMAMLAVIQELTKKYSYCDPCLSR